MAADRNQLTVHWLCLRISFYKLAVQPCPLFRRHRRPHSKDKKWEGGQGEVLGDTSRVGKPQIHSPIKNRTACPLLEHSPVCNTNTERRPWLKLAPLVETMSALSSEDHTNHDHLNWNIFLVDSCAGLWKFLLELGCFNCNLSPSKALSQCVSPSQ